MTNDRKEKIETPHVMLMIRKFSRMFAGIWFVIMGIIFLVGTYHLYVEWRSTGWPSVRGKIVEGGNFAPKGQNSNIAVVEYRLDGKRHRHPVNYRMSVSELGMEDLAHVRKFAHGARVDVYYYPGDTSKPLKPNGKIYFRENTTLMTGIAPDGFDFIYFIIGIGLAAMIFWRAPDWFINRFQKTMIDALADPDKEVFIAEAKTATSSHQHIEIRNKRADGDHEPYVEEDQNGQVLFDSTQRPVRLVFGGIFFVIGIGIGVFMFLASDDIGFFEYFFVTGWSAVTIFTMGFVYEVRLNKQKGIADKKFGWFFIVFHRRFQLEEFTRVIVEKTFHRSRYDRVKERHHTKDPKFSVNLDGKRSLNLKVFSRYSDAALMGKEVAVYLGLPFEEKSQVIP